MGAPPPPASVLGALTQARFVKVTPSLGVTAPASVRKAAPIACLVDAASRVLPDWLAHLYQDEFDLNAARAAAGGATAPAPKPPGVPKAKKPKPATTQPSLPDDETE